MLIFGAELRSYDNDRNEAEKSKKWNDVKNRPCHDIWLRFNVM